MATLDVKTLTRDASLTYRPQREWIEGRGILLVVAHFFSGVGAGAWVFSWWFGFRPGLLVALVCVGALAGPAHLMFLGRWQRFWRMLARPRSSWISRGLWGIAIFLAGAVAYVIWGADRTLGGQVALAASLAGAAVILLYKGFVLSASRAIPLWHTSLLPLLYVAYGLRGGAAALLVTAAVGGGGAQLHEVEMVKLWAALSTAILMLLFLVSAGLRGGAAEVSLRELVAGRVSAAFYGGVVLLGLVVPIGIGAAGAVTGLSAPVVGLAAVASMIGDFYVKYCVMKAGVFVPIAMPGPRR